MIFKILSFIFIAPFAIVIFFGMLFMWAWTLKITKDFLIDIYKSIKRWHQDQE